MQNRLIILFAYIIKQQKIMQRSFHTNKPSPLISPGSLKSHNPILLQIHSQKLQKEYVMQHERWDELRHKLKSMQLNKISVTSYLHSNSSNNNDNRNNEQTNRTHNKNDSKSNLKSKNRNYSVNSVNLESKKQKQSPLQKSKDHDEFEDPEKFDLFKNQMKGYVTSNKLYASRNKPKQLANKPKTYLPLTPYFSYAYQLQKLRPSTQQSPCCSPSDPALASNSLAPTPKPPKKLVSSACSSYRANTNMTKKTQNCKSNRLKSTNSKSLLKNNDLVQFSQLEVRDYHERNIVRRKSNVVGDCIQAIEAAVVRDRLLLFTAVVTSGQANYFADIKYKPPTDIFNDNCDPCKPLSELTSKQIKHTSTGSHEMRLLLGSYQIAQYLQMVGFSSHPLEIQASIRRLGIILVDYLNVTEKGLKLDKNQLSTNLGNLSAEAKSSTVNEIQKLLKNSQLIRWKNGKQKGRKNKNRNKQQNKQPQQSKTKPKSNLSHHHLYEHAISSKESQAEFYRVYGHPHPKVNSKEYEQIKSYEESHGEEPIKENVENNESKVLEPSKKTIKQEVSEELVSQNRSKVLSEIEEKVTNKQSINPIEESVKEEKQEIVVENSLKQISESIV